VHRVGGWGKVKMGVGDENIVKGWDEGIGEEVGGWK